MTSSTSDIAFLAPSGLAVTLSPDEYRLALLWLIASETPMWDQRGLTERWLAEHGTPTHRADFERVSATRYELQP